MISSTFDPEHIVPLLNRPVNSLLEFLSCSWISSYAVVFWKWCP